MIIYVCYQNQVQLSAEDDDAASTIENNKFSDDGATRIDQDLRGLLTNILIDNTNLRKQVNSIMRYALKIHTSADKNNDEQPLEHFVQNESIDR